MVTKKRQIIYFFCLLFFLVVGSGIRDGKQSGSGIQDKHLASAAVLLSFSDSTVSEDAGSILASSDTVESEGWQMKQC
jgi:hypothetical protein